MLQEEVKVANSLKDTTNIHDLPSILDARVNVPKGSLKDVDEWYKVSSDFVEEKDRQVEKYQKDA